MKTTLTLLALAAALAISPVAMADTFTYSFTTTNSVTFGFGDLTATGTEVSPGMYLITDGTVNLFAAASTGLPVATGSLIPVTLGTGGPPVYLSPGGSFNYDNLLTPAAIPSLDYWGLLFKLSNTQEFNIYANGAAPSTALEYTFYDSNGANINGNFNVINTTVPDGGMTLMLLGGAMFGLATLRRKFRV
jgi:hypothetical protein